MRISLCLVAALALVGCELKISTGGDTHTATPPATTAPGTTATVTPETSPPTTAEEASPTTSETVTEPETAAASGPPAEAIKGSSLPDSAMRLLTDPDLQGASARQLELYRFEIHARRGRIFSRPDLSAHFEQQPWYRPNPSFSEADLSPVEARNFQFITDFQRRKGLEWKPAKPEPEPAPQKPKPTRRGGVEILPQSDNRLLTDADLRGLSSRELRLARNEIYARHGRIFSDASLQAYFDSQGWYERDRSFTESRLSRTERENAERIRRYEERGTVGGSSSSGSSGSARGGYILPDSSSRRLSADEVRRLSAREKRLARNEIYARHGRIFNDRELQRYFDSQPWYQRNPGFSESQLSKTEAANIELIRQLE